MDTLTALFVFALVVAVITFVGHGLWIFFAAAGRLLTGDQLSGNRNPRRPPIRPPRQPLTRQEELDVVRRQLQRLFDTSQIDSDTYLQAMQAVAGEMRAHAQPTASTDRPLAPHQAVDKQAPTAAPSPPPVAADDRSTTSSPAIPVEPLLAEVIEPSAPAEATVPVAAAVSAPHPLDVVEAEPVAPPAPSRSESAKLGLAAVLSTFMDEKNIRWGEVLSGMLIVGSAVGLVISLWSTLEAIPYFPALLFMGVTLAIYAAGMYTLKRWRLRSTSQGLLIIALLLIPLNFVAGIALSKGENSAIDFFYLAAVAVGLNVFGGVAFSAGRALFSRTTWLLPIAIVGTSATQLIIDRTVQAGSSLWQLAILALLPVAFLVVVVLGQLQSAPHTKRITGRRAGETLLMLGLSLFALVISHGLLVYKGVRVASSPDALSNVLSAMSPGICLASLSILASGLFLHRRSRSARMASYRVTGMAIVILSGFAILTSFIFAWPRPGLLIAMCAISVVALSTLAIFGRLRYLHGAAFGCLAFTLLLLCQIQLGKIDWSSNDPAQLIDALRHGHSAVLLTLIASVGGLVAAMLDRRGQRALALVYGTSTTAIAGVSLVIALYAGFHSAGEGAAWATAIFSLYSVVALVGSRLLSRVEVMVVGSVLMLVALLHALTSNPVIEQFAVSRDLTISRPVLVAFLLHAGISALIALGNWWRSGPRVAFTNWMSISALVTSTLALPSAVWVEPGHLANHLIYVSGIAAVWLIAAIVRRSAPLFSASQTLATIGVGFAVALSCQQQAWWSGAYFDPRHIQAQIIALALWCLVFSGLRHGLRGSTWVRSLCHTNWPAVDRILLQGLVVAITGLALLGCMPGVTREFYVSGATAPIGLLLNLSGAKLIVLALLTMGTVAALLSHATGSMRSLGWRPLLVTLASFVVLVVSHLGPLSEQIWQWIGVDDRTLATSGYSWLAVGFVALALLVALRERFTTASCSALFYLGSAIPLLVAAQFDSQLATASALRWGMALFALFIAALLYQRHAIRSVARGLGIVSADGDDSQTTETIRTVVLIQVALPVLALSLGIVIAAAVNGRLGGPEAETLFDRLGTNASYAGPLLLLAFAWANYAWRERGVSFALAATLLVNLAVSCSQMIVGSMVGTSGTALVVNLLATNMMATAFCLVTWIVLRQRFATAAEPATPRTLPGHWASWDLPPWNIEAPNWSWGALTTLLASQVSTMIAWILLAIYRHPDQLSATTALWQHWLGYAGLGAASLGMLTYAWRVRRRWLVDLSSLSALGLVALLTVSLSGPVGVANWHIYHGLLIGLACLATILTGLCWIGSSSSFADRRWGESFASADVISGARRWSAALLMLLIPFALRGAFSDLTGPWWSAATVSVAAMLVIAHGLMTRGKLLAYLSTGLAALASFLVWVQPYRTTGDFGDFLHLIEAIIIATCLLSLLWLVMDCLWRREESENEQPRSLSMPAVYHVVSILGLLTMALVYFPSALMDGIFEFDFVSHIDFAMFASIAALGLLLFATLWIPTARYNVAGLYLLGMLACLLGLLRWGPASDLRKLLIAGTVMVACYVLLTSTLWNWRDQLLLAAKRGGVPDLPQLATRTWRWLCSANILVSCCVVVIAGFISIGGLLPDSWRGAGPLAIALLVPALAMLSYGDRETRLPLLSLLLAAVAVVYFGWAQLNVTDGDKFWLLHAIRATVALATVAFAYGTVFVRLVQRESRWFSIVRHAAVIVAGVTIVALLWSLSMEAAYAFQSGRMESGANQSLLITSEMIQITIVLVGLAATLISIALLPGYDPFGLNDRGRMVYVYAAELVLALIFVHIWLTMPEWFHGRIKPFWPLIVMAIAFGGRLLGVLAQRVKLPVLVEPLERSGALLPLLPALGFALLNDNLRVSYSVTLLTVGVFYLVLAMVRRKPIYTAAAVLAGNGMLWALFYEQQWELFKHPQLWLIPPAISALVAAQLNRHRLREDQLTAIRYFSAAVIYISSTGEMFMRGVDENLWPVMVVAGLSVLGALVGIGLRIRAFLYLGTSFLMVSLVSMVWHAAAAIDEVWPWWVFGIALGVALLVMFGFFEKKRDDLSQLLQGLRQWEP